MMERRYDVLFALLHLDFSSAISVLNLIFNLSCFLSLGVSLSAILLDLV